MSWATDLPGSAGKAHLNSNKGVGFPGKAFATSNNSARGFAHSIAVATGERSTTAETCSASSNPRAAILKCAAKASTECASNYSFKPRPLRGSANAVSCTTPPCRYAVRLNSGVRRQFTIRSDFLMYVESSGCLFLHPIRYRFGDLYETK